MLLQSLEVDASDHPDLYVISADSSALSQAMLEADRIRAEFPGLRVVQHLGGGSLKSQFKRADKSGASWAMVYGPDELAQGTVTVKPLRTNEEQTSLDRGSLNNFLHRLERLASDIEE
jgi:histidyl-tRNA synthetase